RERPPSPAADGPVPAPRAEAGRQANAPRRRNAPGHGPARPVGVGPRPGRRRGRATDRKNEARLLPRLPPGQEARQRGGSHTADAPWDLRRVVHLHRRAGFAATWAELQRGLNDGPAASVDRLLHGRSRMQGVPADFESTSALLADAAVAADDPARLKAWWVYRM